MSREELVGLLSATVGAEKASEVIDEAIASTRIGKGPYSLEQAIDVLTRVGETDRLLQTTTRFAKTRLHLKAASIASATIMKDK